MKCESEEDAVDIFAAAFEDAVVQELLSIIEQKDPSEPVCLHPEVMHRYD